MKINIENMTMRSAAEAKPVNSPHPRRGQRRDRIRIRNFCQFAESAYLRSPTSAADPSKKHLQNHSKIRPWKKSSKVEKECSPRPPNELQWRPKSANFCKKCLPKRRQKKKGSQWCIWGCSGPPVSSKMTLPPPREHSFHISTCRSKVLQNGSQWPSCEALWRPKSTKSLSKDLLKKQQKIMRFLMLPGPQNDLEMGSKWRLLILSFWFFSRICRPIASKWP